MFVAKCKSTFLKLPLKGITIVSLVAFFSVSAYGQKHYFAYDPDIPSETDESKLSFSKTSDSYFLYGQTKLITRSGFDSTFSQKFFLYNINDHSSTELIKFDISSDDFFPKYLVEPYFARFIKAKNKTYIISNGRLVVTDYTPSGTKLLKKFGTRYCCQIGSHMSRIYPLEISNDELFFSFQDSIDVTDPYFQYINSMSVWKTDGTILGTKQISQSITNLSSSFLVNTFVNSFVAPNDLFYFSKGGLWVTNNNEKPFVVLEDKLIKSFNNYYSKVVTTTRGNFMCGLNYNKTGDALWRFSNSGKFEIIADGCTSIVNTFNDRVFYIVDNQLWVTDGTSLGEQKLLNLASDQYGISSCRIGNDFYLNSGKYNSRKNQFFRIYKNGIIEDLSTKVSPYLGIGTRIKCIKDRILFISDQNTKSQVSYSVFNPENSEIKQVLNQEPKKLRNTNKNLILANSFSGGRPFLLSETQPPNLGTLFLLLDED